MPGYVGINVTGNGFSIGNGGTNPGYFNSKGFQIADDVDLVRGNHQLSMGGNWIHSRIETLNNRPTNGAFTFNGQSTGLSLADFMLGIVSGGFIQGNPVYDYDHSEYVGAYAQDNWRVRTNLTVNLGLRWEPFLPVQNAYSWVSHFDRDRFDQNVHSTVYPQAPAGLMFPGDAGYPGDRHDVREESPICAARRHGLDAEWRRADERPRLVGRLLRHAASLLQYALCEQPAVGRADHDSQSARRFRRSVSGYPGGNPFPGVEPGWPTQPFPAFGVYVNTPLHTGADGAATVERQRATADRRLARLRELSRESLQPSLESDRTQPGGLRPRRHNRQHQRRAACCSSRTSRRGSSTARSASSMTPAARTMPPGCFRCSAV